VDLTVLGTALVFGQLIELRPVNRSPLPVGFSIVVVLLMAASPEQFVVIVVTTTATALLLRARDASILDRALVSAEWLAAALGAGAIFRLITSAAGTHSTVSVLGALAGAAVIEIVVADVVECVRHNRIAPLRARSADVALITSGMLMAVGYAGIAGQGRLGLWGPALFSVPLIAAWYSFRLLESTRRTYRQTVRALGVAPELGGLVRAGHAERVAALAVVLGEELGIGGRDLEDLETAAWLHHLGAVCFDQPSDGSHLGPTEVARSGAAMLQASQGLSRAGDIVEAEPTLHRPALASPANPASLMGQVLKVASAYDELTEGDDSHGAWAVEALFTGPAYVYDGKVLAALESVLARRGLLAT
jgi:hypothetical protein